MDSVMNFANDIFSVFGSINWVTIFQLISVALILIAGPAVIVLLALRGGDL